MLFEQMLNSSHTMAAPHRNGAVDTIRTLSLIGICLVNMPFLGLSTEQAMSPPPALLDRSAAFAVESLFQMKFFLLFSFLFGWGMHIQDLAAQKAGVAFAGRYGRRLAGLALLGILHGVLVFTGDILLLYAVAGLLIWPARGLPPRRLLQLAAAMIPLAVVLTLALLLIPAGPGGVPPTAGLGDSYSAALAVRLRDWLPTVLMLMLLQGPLVLAAFAAGLAAARTTFLTPGSAGRQRLAAAQPVLLAIGVPLNLLYAATTSGMAAVADGWPALLAVTSITLGAPALAAVYLHLILRLSDRMTLPPLLERAGRNSLSAYVLQGVLAGFVFGGYGLGLFGQVGQAGLAVIGLLVAVAAMLIIGVLAGRLGRGPLEIVLRRITYGAAG